MPRLVDIQAKTVEHAVGDSSRRAAQNPRSGSVLAVIASETWRIKHPAHRQTVSS